MILSLSYPHSTAHLTTKATATSTSTTSMSLDSREKKDKKKSLLDHITLCLEVYKIMKHMKLNRKECK
jgi:hypothetical protein